VTSITESELVESAQQSPSPLTLARVEIRPRDGSPTIYGDLRAPPGRPPRSAIVVCHGFKGFKDWGFFPWLARSLAQRGHAVLSFNFSRSGVVAHGVDFSALDRFAESTHSRNVEEIHMVLDAVTDGGLFPQPPERVGLFGHSRGGGEAVLAASEDPRVSALVTWAAIATVERWGPEHVRMWEAGETTYITNARTGQQMPMGPGFWRDLADNRERLDILRAARSLAVPWLIVHGDDDTSVAPSDAHALWDVAGEDAELLLIEGGNHTFGAVHPFAGSTPALDTAVEATADWFDRFLR
jgi:dienelactone hydrolase